MVDWLFSLSRSLEENFRDEKKTLTDGLPSGWVLSLSACSSSMHWIPLSSINGRAVREEASGVLIVLIVAECGGNLFVSVAIESWLEEVFFSTWMVGRPWGWTRRTVVELVDGRWLVRSLLLTGFVVNRCWKSAGGWSTASVALGRGMIARS